MCATNDLTELRKLRRKMKSIRAWKVLRKSGLNVWTRYALAEYGPGQVRAKGVSRATCYGKRGLHVYRTKRDASSTACGARVAVPIYINPRDLIAAEPPKGDLPELVVCRLTIRPEDWAAAGLPKRATRRRYV
jgi:hypothetical protein